MKTKLLSFFLAICLLCGCVVLPSCEKQGKHEKFSAYSFDYFDTVTTITGYAENQEAFDIIANAVLAS